MNFEPAMPRTQLIKGYETVLATIYSHKSYYDRIKTFLRTYKPVTSCRSRISFADFKAFIRSVWLLGIKDAGRKYYWKAILQGLLKPRCFSLVVAFTIMGMHFRKTFEDLRPKVKYMENNPETAKYHPIHTKVHKLMSQAPR
jgi:hypothetical protein